MGTRRGYVRGVFCWVDLTTSDTDVAKAFYEALFAWKYDERDAGDGRTYTMAMANGNVVAGLIDLVDDGPPRWQSYIAVESADDTVNAAKAAGATIVMAPTDVGTAGRQRCSRTRRTRSCPSGRRVSVLVPSSSMSRARCAGTTS